MLGYVVEIIFKFYGFKTKMVWFLFNIKVIVGRGYFFGYVMVNDLGCFSLGLFLF